MKVLLIQPPLRDFYQTPIRTQPVGLAYVAASLEKHGHEVQILDCQTRKKTSIPIPSELSYLRNIYPFHDRSPFNLYRGYYHFGMSWDEIRGTLEASKADVFGISSSFTPYHGEALEVARILKEWDTRKIVVMGGAHVSGDPEGVLANPLVDYVVVGEGEARFPLLLKEIERQGKGGIETIDGIGYRAGGKKHLHPLQGFVGNLDTLPHPARHLLDLDRYRLGRKRSTMIITSRGCPHGCAYCSAHLVMGTTFRTRSPEAVLQEMTEVQDRHGVQVFDIEDDNFTFDQNRAKRLMRLIIETFGTQRLELCAMNGVSLASLDGELLKLMKMAGFKGVNLSFVSTDRSVKTRMKRPGLTADFDDILKAVEAAGLQATVYAIFGMPGQTLQEMVDTLVYLMGRRVLLGPSVYYPTPGTPLFEVCRREGSLPPSPSQWRSSAFPVETKDFDRLDLVTLFRLARVVNFIKGKMDSGALTEGMTWRELLQRLRDRRGTEERAEAEVKGKGEDEPEAQGERSDDLPWERLLLFLFQQKSFFSLREDPRGKVSLIWERSSRRVLDRFFEEALDAPIRKSGHAGS